MPRHSAQTRNRALALTSRINRGMLAGAVAFTIAIGVHTADGHSATHRALSQPSHAPATSSGTPSGAVTSGGS